MLNGRQMDRLTREESLNALLEKLTAVGQLELGLIARKYLLACRDEVNLASIFFVFILHSYLL